MLCSKTNGFQTGTGTAHIPINPFRQEGTLPRTGVPGRFQHAQVQNLLKAPRKSFQADFPAQRIQLRELYSSASWERALQCGTSDLKDSPGHWKPRREHTPWLRNVSDIPKGV